MLQVRLKCSARLRIHFGSDRPEFLPWPGQAFSFLVEIHLSAGLLLIIEQQLFLFTGLLLLLAMSFAGRNDHVLPCFVGKRIDFIIVVTIEPQVVVLDIGHVAGFDVVGGDISTEVVGNHVLSFGAILAKNFFKTVHYF